MNSWNFNPNFPNPMNLNRNLFPVSVTTSNSVSNPISNNPLMNAAVPNATQSLPLNTTVNSISAPRPDNSRPPAIPKREFHRSRSINRSRGGGAGAGGGGGGGAPSGSDSWSNHGGDMVEEIGNM